jgi:hypothetical protein
MKSKRPRDEGACEAKSGSKQYGIGNNLREFSKGNVMRRYAYLCLAFLLLFSQGLVLALIGGRGSAQSTIFQGYTRLWVGVSPKTMNLTGAPIGVASIIISNLGPGISENTFVSVTGTGCSLVSTNGEKWARNITFPLGSMPAGYSRTLSVIIQCNDSSGSIVVTAFSDNCDPVIAEIDVQRSTRSSGLGRPSPGDSLVPVFAVTTTLLLLIITSIFLRRNRRKKKRSIFE